MVFTLLLCTCTHFVYGQPETFFTKNDMFDIPESNSSISFATEGTYEKAKLENSVWIFENLRLNNSQNVEKLGLKVSAKDCKVNIISFQIFNSTFAGQSVKRASLRYTVIGNGIQIFDLGLDPKLGDHAVIFNGSIFAGRNHGWSLSPEGTLIIDGATANVTIAYYGFPYSFEDNTNLIDQHYVVISSTFVSGIIIVISAYINRTRKKSRNNLLKFKHSCLEITKKVHCGI